MRKLASLFVLAVSTSSLALACSGPSAVEDSETSETALRSLKASEIVGTIAFGQTIGPIHYTETPRYRALRFTGSVGETARISVQSKGIAALWLLTSDFTTVTKVQATAPGRPLTLERALRSTGTYYIALREADQEETDFTVTLDRGAAPLPEPPPEPLPGLSIWDASWATAPLATQDDLLKYFAPGQGSVTVGDGVFVMRHRMCNALTGCGTWANIDGVYFYADTYPHHVKKTLPTAAFELVASENSVSLGCQKTSMFDVYWHRGFASCRNAVATLDVVETPYYSGFDLPTSTVGIPYAVHPTYAYGRSGSYNSAVENGNHVEFEYAVYVKLSPAAPTPAFDR